jgi:hypothetical protein
MHSAVTSSVAHANLSSPGDFPNHSFECNNETYRLAIADVSKKKFLHLHLFVYHIAICRMLWIAKQYRKVPFCSDANTFGTSWV